MSNKPFIRFWRGYPKQGLGLDEFQSDINRIFIAETAALSRKGAGLISYQPVLTERDLLEDSELPEIAAEYALVEYVSEIDYQTFRKTEAGQRYSSLHWEFFDDKKSRSAVVQEFKPNGPLDDYQAYALFGKAVDWHKGHSRFSILPKPAMELGKFYRLMHNRPPYGLVNLIFLMMPTHIVQYSLWEDIDSCLGSSSEVFPFPPIMDIETVHERRTIEYGQGINHPQARAT